MDPASSVVMPIARDEVHIWAVRLTRDLACFDELAGSLSTDETDRAARFKFTRDRERFIVGRGVLRSLLARYTDTAPAEMRFRYGPFGRPELAEPSGGLRFNVAHSGDLAVYAVARGEAVGVDVEEMRALPELESLARRYFSSAEGAALRALPPSERSRAFFHCWTQKEAYLKAMGTGLAKPLDRFDVSVGANEPAKLRRVADDPGEAEQWSLFAFAPAANAVGAVAVRRRSVEMTFRELHR